MDRITRGNILMIGMPNIVAITLSVAAMFVGQQTPSGAPDKFLTVTAKVHAAYDRVDRDQAARPVVQSDQDRLVRLGEIDQAGRDVIADIDWSPYSAEEKKALWTTIWAEIAPHDLAVSEAFRAMLPVSGWFPISRYGKAAARAAFLIVQHSPDITFQEAMLQRMAPLVGTSEIEGQLYGLLFDRVSLAKGRPQRYGSQVRCSGGVYRPRDLEDPDHVDDRRRQAGFTDTEADYLKNFDSRACP